jgi:predicted dithiol-disulfide oxidoreductase (DUF899 family)
MAYRDDMAKLEAYRAQIADLRRKLRETQAAIAPEDVTDYELGGLGGPLHLSALFGDHDTLVVIHNMGAGCAHCTMWADGFNGVYRHLSDRAAFVVASPDPPAKQAAFAATRGWKFPMVSYEGNRFGEDMGYFDGKRATPGISVFKRAAGKIMRVSNTSFSPGDDFCTVWHIFDLIPEGAAGWKPKFKYSNDLASS